MRQEVVGKLDGPCQMEPERNSKNNTNVYCNPLQCQLMNVTNVRAFSSQLVLFPGG